MANTITPCLDTGQPRMRLWKRFQIITSPTSHRTSIFVGLGHRTQFDLRALLIPRSFTDPCVSLKSRTLPVSSEPSVTQEPSSVLGTICDTCTRNHIRILLTPLNQYTSQNWIRLSPKRHKLRPIILHCLLISTLPRRFLYQDGKK